MLHRIALTLTLLAVAGPAAAHLGHLGELAGHSHWVAGAALGLAGAIALWAGARLRDGRKPADAAAQDEHGEGAEETAEP